MDDVDAAAAAGPAATKLNPLEALKLGSLRLASMLKHDPKQQQAQADTPTPALDSPQPEQQHSSEVVARLKATAAGLGARAKEQGTRFYQASVKTAASTAEGIKRLAQGEPLQALCRGEVAARPCPQLVLACCTALVTGGGLTTQAIFKHNPPQELVDRLAATAADLAVFPPGASPHAVAGLLKQFLMGLHEPLLTYRLLPQWVAAGDCPASAGALVQQMPPANANALRLLVQTCSYMNEQAAVNEMDSQALAEALAPVLAWKPPPKPQPAASQGAFAGLTKALSLNKATAADAEPGVAAATGPDAAAGAESEGEAYVPPSTAAAAAAAGGGVGLSEAHRVLLLDDAELDAVVTVLEYMISHYSSVFAA
ncbi:Rho GTPase activation protein [Scenedesmus sp. NREL 46B-D3]|nr:Rho GTPase activation protein [Scenedesmus sp. NREL 46B-D3]